MAMFTNMMESRGFVSAQQLQQDTTRMTFGIELECIAVYPKGLFANDKGSHHGDAMAALSLGCLAKGIQSTGHEHLDDEDEGLAPYDGAYSHWNFQDEGGLRLSAKEFEMLGPNAEDEFTIQSIEVASQRMSFHGDNWQREISIVLSIFSDLHDRDVRFITNSTTGFHIYVRFGNDIMPLRTAKNVLELCTGFEDRFDALYSTSRIDENAATNVLPGHPFNAGLAWHFQINEMTDFGPNVFNWLASIEESSSFEELGNFFRNNFPGNVAGKTNAHYSTLNLDNLYMPPKGCEEEFGGVAPIGTIEFRQHGGTLDFEAIVSHVLLKQALVSFCHTCADKDFLQLFAHIWHGNGSIKRAHVRHIELESLWELHIEFFEVDANTRLAKARSKVAPKWGRFTLEGLIGHLLNFPNLRKITQKIRCKWSGDWTWPAPDKPAVVLMNLTSEKKMLLHQFSNPFFYKEIQGHMEKLVVDWIRQKWAFQGTEAYLSMTDMSFMYKLYNETKKWDEEIPTVPFPSPARA
jgi:hypothetical protein